MFVQLNEAMQGLEHICTKSYTNVRSTPTNLDT